jgi:hypothetical protein
MKTPLPKPATGQRGGALGMSLTDTDRLNAIFTLFGGHYAFSPFSDLPRVLRDGRRGIDELIAANPSLLGASPCPCPPTP